MFSEVMRYILDLGPTVMLPVVIIIFSKILGPEAAAPPGWLMSISA